MISESKTGDSFPISQLSIDGLCPPYDLGKKELGGSILVYFKRNIITKPLKIKILSSGIGVSL